jgi:hypothetical protein
MGNSALEKQNFAAADLILSGQAAEDTIFFDGSNWVAKGGAEKIKCVFFFKDLADASGNVAYTGVGFKPSYIISFGCVNNRVEMGIGQSDGTTGGAVAQYNNVADYWGNSIGTGVSAGLIWLGNTLSTNSQYGTIQSFDADGFTINWVKTGTPTGSAKIILACFR